MTSKRPGVPILLALLGFVLVAFAGWAGIRHQFLLGANGSDRRSAPGWRAAPGPAWDRPESPEEAKLLESALARPGDARAQAALGQHYLVHQRPFEALWALQRAREAMSAGAGSPSPPDDHGPRIPMQPPDATDGGSRLGRLTPPTMPDSRHPASLARHPADTNLVLAMATALELAGLQTRALELLNDAALRDPGDPSLVLSRAELQLRLARPEAAIAIVRAPDQGTARGVASGGAPDHQLLLARAFEAAGNDVAARAEYRRCVAADSQSMEVRLRLGRLLVRLGASDAGRRLLAEAHQLAPTAPEPPYALGMSFMPEMRANPDPARSWLSRALEVSPGYRPALVALGRICLEHRYWRPAAEQFSRALQANPTDPEARLGLASVLDVLGHPGAAHLHRGMAYAQQGKLPQALAEFRALKSAQPENPAASMLISQSLIQMQQRAAATIETRAALERHPRDAELKERLAKLYILTRTREPARRLCEAWMQEDPTAAKPLWLLGRILLPDAGQVPQAIDLFERAARFAPQDAEIRFALGEALDRSGPRRDPRRAVEVLGQAVALAPNEARYRHQLGLTLQGLNRPEAARRQFLRALDLNPSLTAVYTGLIQLSGALRENGQIALFAPVVRELQAGQRLETELGRQIARSPEDPAGYAALARYLVERGRLEAARVQWEVAVSLEPRDPAPRRALARLQRILAVL